MNLPRNNSPRCSTVTHLAIAAVVFGGVASAQQSLPQPGSGSRTPVGGAIDESSIPRVPGPSVARQTSGLIFCEKLESALLGYTFDYDSSSGSYVMKRRLFSTTLSDQTGPPDDFRAKFGMLLNSNSYFQENYFGAGIDATLGLTHIAANYASTEASGGSAISTSFQLKAEADFPMAMTDFMQLQQSAFDPAAWQILQMPSGTLQADQARTAAWFGAGFGEFVACGFDLRGAVDVVFTMNSNSHWQDHEDNFALRASYSTVSASLDIVHKMKQALETNALTFGLQTQGCTPPHLPTLQELQTVNGQLAYADELNAHAANCKRRVGLYLASAYALPNGPSIDVPSWDDQVLGQVRTDGNNAIRALADAAKWNFSPRLVAFLSKQMYVQPTGTTSFVDALTVARYGVAYELNDMLAVLKLYADPANSGSQAIKDAVLAAALELSAASTALVDVSTAISVRIEELPDTQFVITESMTPIPGNLGTTSLWMSVEATNVGIFSPISITELEALLAFGTPATESLYLDEYIGANGQLYQTHANSNGGISTVDVLEMTPITSGPGAGLYRVKFDMIVNHVYMNATDVRLRLVDDIDRVGYAHYNLAL